MEKMTKATKEEMQEIELIIGKILRVGVFISVSIMIVGLLIFLITGNSGYSGDYFPTEIKEILAGIPEFHAFAWLMLGLFCLILTPVLRVAISIYAFAKEHDRLYVYITILVLLILAFAVFIGHAGE